MSEIREVVEEEEEEEERRKEEGKTEVGEGDPSSSPGLNHSMRSPSLTRGERDVENLFQVSLPLLSFVWPSLFSLFSVARSQGCMQEGRPSLPAKERCIQWNSPTDGPTNFSSPLARSIHPLTRSLSTSAVVSLPFPLSLRSLLAAFTALLARREDHERASARKMGISRACAPAISPFPPALKQAVAIGKQTLVSFLNGSRRNGGCMGEKKVL